MGLLPREFWVFFCREPNFACLDLNKNSYHKIVTIALQAFSCLQAVSPFLTPALMSLASKFNILTLLSYCILAIWGPGNFIDYVFKYHIVCKVSYCMYNQYIYKSCNRVNHIKGWSTFCFARNCSRISCFFLYSCYCMYNCIILHIVLYWLFSR